MLHLEKLNAKNVWDIVDLKVADSQEDFVASNEVSIIEAYTAIGTGCTAFPFGIFDDETPVGFLMIGFNEAVFDAFYTDEIPEVLKDNYSLWRLMIDEKYQKKGYGKEAVRLALEFIKTWPCGKAEYCVLSYETENEIARKMYHSLGFVETGDMEDNEIIAVLKL